MSHRFHCTDGIRNPCRIRVGFKSHQHFNGDAALLKSNNEVSRITNNRCRIDNASEGRQTLFGTMDESMLLKILGVDPGMTLISSEIAFYSKEDKKKNK